MIVTAGSINVSAYYYIVQDASGTSPGEPATGILFSDIETGGSASYVRQGAARTDLTLITLASASAAHADGGFIEVDGTNMKGLYRCDYPDAVFATGVDQAFLSIVVASGKNAVAAPIKVEITDVDLRDAVRGGMTALPNAVADAAGGLPISDAGGLDLDTQLAATNEVTAARMGALTDWINGGRLDLLLDAIKVPTDKMVFTTANKLDCRVDNWAGTAVTISSTTAKPEVDMFSASDDATAADNFELMYDGTGYTDDTAPASRSQVNNISSVGAAVHVSAIASPGGFVITTGTEVNNEDATIPLDGTKHELTDAAGTLDVLYKFDIGGDAAPVGVTFTGNFNSNNDSWDISANTGTDASPVWVQIGTVTGVNSSANSVETFTMFANMIVSDVAGEVQIRINGTGLTSSSFDVDQVFVTKTDTSRSVGYANGQIWVDTNNGVAGVEPFVNGVADKKKSLTWADALTLSPLVGITDFHIINGSTIQLTGNSDNFSLFGDNWTLDLNGQSVAGAYFQGAHVSGVGVSSSEVHYEGCDIGTMSVQIGHFDFCSFDGTVTHTLAGDYNYHNCYSKVAGVGGPTFTKTAGQVVTAQWRNWAGSMTDSGIQASDVMTISGEELGDIVLNGAEGTVKLLGQYESRTDNRTGSPTLVEGAYQGSDVTAIGVKLDDIQGATFSTGTDSLEAIRDRGDAAWTTGAGGSDRLLMVDTTIATLASQVNFTLTAGSADDKAYENLSIVVEDVSTATQKAVGMVLTYTGATKTVVLKEALSFTIAATDKVYILAENSLKSTVANRQLDVTVTGAAGINWANIENPTTAVDLSGTDIQLVDTTTTNTDMRGTDSALLASSAPTNFGDMAITVTTGRITVGTSNDKTGYSISGAITTLDGLNDFDPTADAVANVTLVATTTTNTDMRGTDSAATASALATVDSNVDAILVDTGTTLPALIDDLAVKKNTAFSNFEFLMVLTSDHVTPAIGLTVTAQRSIDGAAFASVSGAIAEVSNGIYQFDALAADTNGDLITWRFSAATADDTFVTFKTVA